MFLVKYKIEIPFFLYHTDISMRNHYNQSTIKWQKIQFDVHTKNQRRFLNGFSLWRPIMYIREKQSLL